MRLREPYLNAAVLLGLIALPLAALLPLPLAACR